MITKNRLGFFENYSIKVLILFLIFSPLYFQSPCSAKDYYRIDVVGDPHLPGNHPDKKKTVINWLNSNEDTDLVVVVGDLCQLTGTEKELQFAVNFFADLKKPVQVMNGNHDYVFQDIDPASPALVLGSPLSRSKKLCAFLNAFKNNDFFASRVVASYSLIFLAPDDLLGNYYSQMSDGQLRWFEYELFKKKNLPTIVFYHAPLWEKKLLAVNPKLGNYMAQPVDAISKIVRDNPQIQLWVCGHVHFGVFHPMNSKPENIFENKVPNIINCDLDGRSVLSGVDIKLVSHDGLWTKSLFLYPDKIVVKVYDHVAKNWIPELEKEYPVSLNSLENKN
ncbi:MAG: metallophosphoesterase [Candidatus Riflebacteria bacterium]|nr:metallophosphoesterase [Candidatus Riflebacteria bacterium]